jgi:hypothetical protein
MSACKTLKHFLGYTYNLLNYNQIYARRMPIFQNQRQVRSNRLGGDGMVKGWRTFT